MRPVSFDFSLFCVHEKLQDFIHSSVKPQRARMSLISAQNLLPKRLSVIILVFFFVTKSLVIGQKMNYEMCANSLPRPGPTQGKKIQIILRLFLVISMYCQASSSQFFFSITQPLTLLAGLEGTCSR